MSGETIEQKARRYLAGGRLVVKRASDAAITATCRGDTGVYLLGFEEGAWWCSCEARRGCSHLAALRLVTLTPGGADRRGDTEPTTKGAPQ